MSALKTFSGIPIKLSTISRIRFHVYKILILENETIFLRDSQRGAFLSRGVLRPAGKVDQAWQQDLDKSVSFVSRDDL